MLGRILDALHTNLSVRFLDVRLLVAGDFGGRGLRLPDRVEVGDLGGCCNRIAAFDRDSRIVRIPIPAEEFVAVSSWLLLETVNVTLPVLDFSVCEAGTLFSSPPLAW